MKKLIDEIHKNAINKGFWEDYEMALIHDSEYLDKPMVNNAISSRLTLIHSEVSEALDDLREGNMYHFGEELADIVIRVMDLAAGLNIDLEQEINNKIEKNKNRPYKHGKKF